jgi:hypothetical protein
VKHQFIKGILDLNVKNSEVGCQRLVATEESLLNANKIIFKQLPLFDEGEGTYRVPPLVLSRLGRGGKTNMLQLIFNELKKNENVAPIFISFNGNFQRFPGESDEDCILRLIAVQFIDLPRTEESKRYNFQFEKSEVLEHLAQSAGGRSIVLIIDELNSLRTPPIGNTGAFLLRKEFLDKCGRYLVFSTHVEMNLDSVIDEGLGTISTTPSIRGFYSLDF